MLKTRLAYLPLSSIILATWLATPAFAQAADSSRSNPDTSVTEVAPNSEDAREDTTARLKTVTVTAQKREQSLNEVGLSITTATGDQLADLGIQDTGDLAKVTPGLTFTKSQDGTPLYTIRGVGFNDYTLGASPAVSVYVDQVPLAFGAYTKGATLDLERVEVLKGPQGTLFGQNSTGGAINYIAAKPTDTAESGFMLSAGNYDYFDAEAYVSGPLSDTVSARLAIGSTTSGAWQESYTRNDSLGETDFQKARFQVSWDANERLSFLFNANGWIDKSDTQAGQLQGLFLQIPDPTGPTVALADVPETQRRIDAFLALTPAPQNAEAADWDPDRDLSKDDSFYQISLRSDYELTDTTTLTGMLAYSRYKENYSVDRDGTALLNAGVNADGDVDTLTAELRLAGSTDRLEWLVGGNYSSNDVVSANDILTGDSTNTAILPGGPWIAASTTTITQDIEEYAVFANLEYAVSDAITLLGGARYTDSQNDFTSCMRGDAGMQATFGFFANLLSGTADQTPDASTCLNLDQSTFDLIETPFEDSLDEDNFSWRAGVNFEPDADTLLYALASRGFKSGSFPTIPASTTAQFAPVTQESVTAYELGAKLTRFDGSVQLNGAVFHYIYDDKQVRGLIIDPIFNQLEQLVNIPESEITGAEIELTASPMDGLVLRGAASYVDSEVKEFTGINNERVTANYSGSQLPFSPELHLVADIDYRWSISNGLEAFVGGNILHNSDANSTLGDAPNSEIDSFTTLDLRAGFGAADGRWRFKVWGRNVTDEYYWTNQFVTQDVVTRYAAMPATYGVTLEVDF